MFSFEEFEAKENEKLTKLFASVEADIAGTGPPTTGLAGQVVAEFKGILPNRDCEKRQLTDGEVEEMTDEVLKRFYKLVNYPF